MLETLILLSVYNKNTTTKTKKKSQSLVHCMESDIQILDWPAQLSDANSIENVWFIIKRKTCIHFKAIVSPCLSYLVVATICGKSYRKYTKTMPANSR